MVVPITGQVAKGTVTLLVAWMENVKPGVLVNENVGMPPVARVLLTIGLATPVIFCTTDAWLNAPQSIFVHEERSLHRAVMSPKPHRPPRRVVGAASIGKTERHGSLL